MYIYVPIYVPISLPQYPTQPTYHRPASLPPSLLASVPTYGRTYILHECLSVLRLCLKWTKPLHSGVQFSVRQHA